jgi:hypothetical protein
MEGGSRESVAVRAVLGVQIHAVVTALVPCSAGYRSVALTSSSRDAQPCGRLWRPLQAPRISVRAQDMRLANASEGAGFASGCQESLVRSRPSPLREAAPDFSLAHPRSRFPQVLARDLSRAAEQLLNILRSDAGREPSAVGADQLPRRYVVLGFGGLSSALLGSLGRVILHSYVCSCCCCATRPPRTRALPHWAACCFSRGLRWSARLGRSVRPRNPHHD